ncbi:MAG TPA: DUF434 domain-containing protein [Opitutaceae bacterium]
MPDKRTHRGAHPDDARLFAADQWPALCGALADLCWLLDRGYAGRSALALVGDRHGLSQRQRIAVARCACSKDQYTRRAAHEVEVAAVAGDEVWLDGYNVLITIESALADGVLIVGRDGCLRDMASLHGSYRRVEETAPALQLIGAALGAAGVVSSHWLLDRPVSNSGRLKAIMEELAAANGWAWTVELAFNPDKVLRDTDAIVASSDSLVLDGCGRWINLARWIVATHLPDAPVLTLGPASDMR